MEQLDSTPAGSIAPMNLKDLAIVLIKHYGLHSGRYEVSLSFQFGVGGLGVAPNLAPGAVIAVHGVGLAVSLHDTANAVDAAEVNPSTPTEARVRPARQSKSGQKLSRK